MIRKLVKWTGNIVLGVLIIAATLSVFTNIKATRNPGQIPSIFGYAPLSVLSGSMRPMLEPGDMIITKKPVPENISIGDVITYRVGSTLVTHRVVDIVTENNNLLFQTQGDANNTIDNKLVTTDELVGTFSFRIPKGGYISNFARSPVGFILLIIGPLFLIAGSEIKTIFYKEEKAYKL